MPQERYAALLRIATVLWQSAYLAGGDKGTPPTLGELSYRNRRRWLGAAIATEALMAQAKQDAVQQSVVINNCIKQLEQYRDSVCTVTLE